MPVRAVSVVLPTYNRAATLGRALASIAAQGRRDIEVIVVDDASTDATAALLAAWTAAPLTVIRHPRNRGAAAARNSGFAAAQGAYIACLDSDDAWLPRKLQIQLAWMEAHPHIAATTTAFELVWPDGRRQVRRLAEPASWRTAFLDGCFVSPGSTLMVRRAAALSVGPYAEELGRFEDWDWLLRLVVEREFANLDGCLAQVHVGTHPAYAAVADACRQLDERTRSVAECLGGRAGGACFRASLEIEKGLAAWRDGQAGMALCHAAWAALLSPARAQRAAARLAGRR